MANKGKYIILIFCFCLSFKIKAQQNDMEGSLTALTVENKELISLLDSVVAFEKQCDYYDPELFFYIDMQFAGECLILQIGSIDRIIKSDGQLGGFDHQGHLFVVSGKRLDSSLFSTTKSKKEITYYEPKEGYDPESGEVVVDLMEDDRFSFWVYKYKNDEFILDVKHTYCK